MSQSYRRKNASAEQGGGGKGKCRNTINQDIGQSQSSNRIGTVAPRGDPTISGNNLNTQSQTNTGNNAAAQQGGGGGKGGNNANQAIGQSQSSNQNSGVVSGGNTAGSGNNQNTQSQNNTGNNAAAQQ
jgi:hypothetical protein